MDFETVFNFECSDFKNETTDILQELNILGNDMVVTEVDEMKSPFLSNFQPSFIPSSPCSDNFKSIPQTPASESFHDDNSKPQPPRKTFTQMFPEISKELHKSLLNMSVKDFNSSVRQHSLSNDAISYLKLERKRNKNRDAAVRSRAKKDTYVQTLEKELNSLRKENQRNIEFIRSLQERIEKLESKNK